MVKSSVLPLKTVLVVVLVLFVTARVAFSEAVPVSVTIYISNLEHESATWQIWK